MLDLHNRRPGRAANTSRSLCLQRPGRKHAPNLPLLHRPRKDNGNQHIIPQWIKHRKTLNSNKAGWPKTKQSQRVSSSVFTSVNKDGLHVLELTTDHAWHSVIGRHLPLAWFGAQLLDLLFLSAVKQWSLLCGHQQHLVTVFHLNHTWRLFQQQDGVTHTLLKNTNTPVLPSYHLSKQVHTGELFYHLNQSESMRALICPVVSPGPGPEMRKPHVPYRLQRTVSSHWRSTSKMWWNPYGGQLHQNVATRDTEKKRKILWIKCTLLSSSVFSPFYCLVLLTWHLFMAVCDWL